MFRLTTLVNGAYWTCASMFEAFTSARNVSASTYDVVIVENTSNGRVAYMVNGHVSVFVKNGMEYDRWHKR